MDVSSSKKRKSESDLGRPPIRKNPTIGGVFRLYPEEFENNSLNIEKRTPNVNSLLKTASGLLQKKNTKLQKSEWTSPEWATARWSSHEWSICKWANQNCFWIIARKEYK